MCKIAFKIFEGVWSAWVDNTPSTFLNTVFHKFYLVNSWILCLIHQDQKLDFVNNRVFTMIWFYSMAKHFRTVSVVLILLKWPTLSKNTLPSKEGVRFLWERYIVLKLTLCGHPVKSCNSEIMGWLTKTVWASYFRQFRSNFHRMCFSLVLHAVFN